MTKWMLTGWAAAVTVTVASAGVGNGHSSAKIAGDLRESMSLGRDQRVIVSFAPGVADQDAVASLSRTGKAGRRLGQDRMFAASLNRRDIEALASDARVISISPDRRVAATMDIAVPTVGGDRLQTYLGYKGQGVTVAVIDSGVMPTNSVAASRLAARIDFTDSLNVNDQFGHGTHIASTIAGSGDKGSVRGMAPAAKIVSLKVLDANGQGFVSDVIRAIDWSIQNRAAYGIRILNLSFGHPPAESYATDPLAHAVERAWAAGLVVITSAGSRGRDGFFTINSPGNDPYVLTVGAMNDMNTAVRSDDVTTTYSSRGPSYGDHILKPDVVAPGNKIVGALAMGTTLPRLYPDRVVGRDRIELSGSSMAAAVTSGAVALLLERNPRLTPDQVKAILLYSSDHMEGADRFVVGARSEEH